MIIRFITILLTIFSIKLFAKDVNINKILIEEKIDSIVIQEIDSKELKSADLAEALSNKVPSVSIVRRNAIANDIILRGQKRDNINIIIDGTKIYGGCPNRMDPPISHITTHTLSTIQIQEGPFDVENFGTLSGLVNITTKEPKSNLSGEINLGIGSFEYKKASLSLSGGVEKLKALLTISKESSSQYKDGDGKRFYEQIPNQMVNYQPQYQNMDAYEKNSLMLKLFSNITKDQNLKLSYIANRSKNILYPSSKMDAIWDDSDIINLNYEIKNLATYSKTLTIQTYYSKVDHPMSVKYRNSAISKGNITNHLTSKIQGFKLKNGFEFLNSYFIVGLDTSKREWDGAYYKDIEGEYMRYSLGEIKKSIDNVTTTNQAIFIKAKSKIKNIDIDSGIRYDDTTIKDSYNSLSANIFATFNASESLKYFAGIGKSSRVPDARELYFVSMMAQNPNMLKGTPTLNQTTNYEIDFGFEKLHDNFSIKTKFFYSRLKDYIYINANKMKNVFENIDAKIYGVEFSGVYVATDNLYINYGASYKVGKKDKPLNGQNDKDLAEITPPKANITIEYEYDDSLNTKLDIIGVSSWKRYDSDNGEQPLSGYMIFNLKINKEFSNAFSMTFGVDNIFDKTYATTNTYKDLTLITTGMNVNDVMLLNEPGRYVYLNIAYKF